ncbi:MAG: hypothetical protein GY935_09300 [Gammaproteobacteria bacterium]|nr:hypothetical protein [Gammaproteobacteria bacterium]
MLHLALHLVVPLIVAYGFFPKPQFAKIFLILCATMLVDLDHLLAEPIYDPLRCSIGFHPMHQFIPIGFYGLMLIDHRLRMIGLGLLIHMLLDLGDCVSMGQFP